MEIVRKSVIDYIHKTGVQHLSRQKTKQNTSFKVPISFHHHAFIIEKSPN